MFDRFDNEDLICDGCIDTYTGLKFSFVKPKKEQINIVDIAKGLAYKAHFGGQTPDYFSIAQHTLLVLDVMPKKYCQDYEMSMAALLHDASEAYTGDILKPLKIMLPKFQDIEKRVTEVIFNKFDIDISLLEKIKPFDIKAQKIEYNFFYRKKNNLSYMLPEYAYHTFMHKYRMIKKIIKNEVYKNQ